MRLETATPRFRVKLSTTELLHSSCVIFWYTWWREHSDSVVDFLTGDRRATGSSFPGVTVLCPWARHVYLCLVLVQPRKSSPDITKKCWLGRRESNQTNKTNDGIVFIFDKNIHLFVHIVGKWFAHTCCFWLKPLTQMYGQMQGTVAVCICFQFKKIWPSAKGPLNWGWSRNGKKT